MKYDGFDLFVPFCTEAGLTFRVRCKRRSAQAPLQLFADVVGRPLPLRTVTHLISLRGFFFIAALLLRRNSLLVGLQQLCLR